jgi:hypothetical protein
MTRCVVNRSIDHELADRQFFKFAWGRQGCRIASLQDLRRCQSGTVWVLDREGKTAELLKKIFR